MSTEAPTSMETETVASETKLESNTLPPKPKFEPLKAHEMSYGRIQFRKVSVPPYRYSPLKKYWMDIYTPIYEQMKIDIRMNLKARKVELKTRSDTPDVSNLQKCAGFVQAFMLGFNVPDAIALLRLDELYVESFEIKDVKTLRGEHLSRAIGVCYRKCYKGSDLLLKPISPSSPRWPEPKSKPDPTVRPVSIENQARFANMQMQNKVLNSCKEFFKNRVRDEENDDGDDDDFDEEEEKNKVDMFFMRIFVNNSELRGYYEENHEKGEFFCLVCGGIGENLGKKFHVCVGLVQHCMSILKTKCKTGNRAFGLVVYKVLGWDIDRLPVILLKGEPLSRILANSCESQNILQGEGSNKNVKNLKTGNSSGKVQKDASDSLLDRFIPNRSAMDYDYAHYMLTEGRKIKENQTVFSPARDADRITSHQHLLNSSIGLNNSEVQLWDSASNRQLHALRGCHRSRMGSMAWNSHFLTTGGMDATGQWRHDNLVHIWDMSKASSNSPTQWIHRLEDHTYGIWDMSKAQKLAKEKADIAINSLQCLPQSLQIKSFSEKYFTDKQTEPKIHILGSFANIKIARDSLCSLILGSAAGKVNSKLRQVTARLAETF
ncbi:hypothetical protein CXB51_034420 [Gossypium anomalum]|uniref:PNO1 second type I KH domain-containing protein n=1 Tax=Gossypium anomalum TaxID=47600 RepID=A0A8J6CEX2_9ROSI|nr:hypothetical protein CXB51_034420 [Gossypium anomalum]